MSKNQYNLRKQIANFKTERCCLGVQNTASSSCYAITQVLLRRVLRKAILRKQKAS